MEPRLKSRLLSPEEVDIMADRIQNEPLSDEEQSELFRKFNEHLSEKSRRKRTLKKQGHEVRDTIKRRKLNERFDFLNDVLKKVKVEQHENSLKNGQILLFDLYTKGSTTFTVSNFMEIVKPESYAKRLNVF